MTTEPVVVPRSSPTAPEDVDSEDRARRYDELIRLLDEWMADESGYDEETWPELKAALDHNRDSYRKLFNE